MNIIKAAFKADWAPTIESIARALGWLVAVAIVLLQWLAFTWRRPLAGLEALLRWQPVAAPAPAPAPEPLLLMPVAPVLLLSPAREPIPAPAAPPARKRGRRVTRQPKVMA
jgi:hypothetical protein